MALRLTVSMFGFGLIGWIVLCCWWPPYIDSIFEFCLLRLDPFPCCCCWEP